MRVTLLPAVKKDESRPIKAIILLNLFGNVFHTAILLLRFI